jgi:lysozyme family protein
MRYAAKWPQYAKWWDSMKIKASREAEFNGYAKQLLEHKAKYQEIESLTGVPWHLSAVIHLRESEATVKGEASYNFNTYLGNGQPLKRRTTLVPKNRGPFLGPNAFVDGAVDALKQDDLTNVKDWRLEKELYNTEIFNGTGYDGKGLPSPYVWGGTNIQQPGKYVADGKFNRKVWDTQPGTAPILFTLAKLDPTIQFVRET